MMIILVAFTVLVGLASPPTVSGQPSGSESPNDLDCYHEAQAQKHQLKCFTDQDIHISYPMYESEDGAGASQEEQKQNYVNAIIAQNPDRICSRQKNFKLALECAMNHTVSCMPFDYRGFLPQPPRMGALVDKLCENTTKIRFNCVARKAGNLFTCGFKKGQKAFRVSNRLVSLEDFLCKAFQFNAQCQLEELRSCGCATVRLYESLSRDFLYPPRCPRPMLETTPTQCNPRNEALFMGDGSQNGAQGSVQARLALTVGSAMAFIALWCFDVLFTPNAHRYSKRNSVLPV